MIELKQRLLSFVGFAIAAVALAAPLASASQPTMHASKTTPFSEVVVVEPATPGPHATGVVPTPFARPEITGPAKLPPEEAGLPGS